MGKNNIKQQMRKMDREEREEREAEQAKAYTKYHAMNLSMDELVNIRSERIRKAAHPAWDSIYVAVERLIEEHPITVAKQAQKLADIQLENAIFMDTHELVETANSRTLTNAWNKQNDGWLKADDTIVYNGIEYKRYEYITKWGVSGSWSPIDDTLIKRGKQYYKVKA